MSPIGFSAPDWPLPPPEPPRSVGLTFEAEELADAATCEPAAESPFLRTAPGWLFSLAIHGTILLGIATTLNTFGGGSAGDGVGGGAAIEAAWSGSGGGGSPFEPSEPGGSESEGPEVKVVPADAPRRTISAAIEEPEIPLEPPTRTGILRVSGETVSGRETSPREERPLGKAPRKSRGTGSGLGEAAEGKPGIGGSLPGDGRGGLGGGGTSFFGIRTEGRRIVYVIDCSESMEGAGLDAAKQELIASLADLRPSHRFGILFYNQDIKEMPAGREPSGLPVANDISRRVARQFIEGARAEFGTSHMRALRRALLLAPDVIYLLTDAGEPELSPDDLNTIQHLNRGRAVIHCVEFDTGVERPHTENFLKSLARQNGGRHRVCDPSRFQAPEAASPSTARGVDP